MSEESNVTRAKHVYPAIKQYVAYARALGTHHPCVGLCYGVPTYADYPVGYTRLKKLLKYYVENEPNATPACATRDSLWSTPFNCGDDEGCNGSCGCSDYSAEIQAAKSGEARLNNPYRRAFINWVCRLAGKPELLP